MTERDIWLTANLMLKRFGADAALEANIRADEFLAEGDFGGQRIWMRILAAIRALSKLAPDGRPN